MKARQAGAGMIPMLLVLGTVVIFATVIVKLSPIYIDHWTLARILSDVATEERSSDPTPAGIYRDLSNRFITNRVESISLRDIKISTDEKGIVIDARYEKRTSLMFNVDAVVRFDNAIYMVPRR